MPFNRAIQQKAHCFLAATFMDIAGVFDNITFETINEHMGDYRLDTQAD